MIKFFAWIGVISVVLFGVAQCNQSEWFKAEQKASAAREVSEETPHIIRRSADGCQVYAFKVSGTWHYFTRCTNAASVTTDRNYTENCGKNCTRQKVEQIVTTESKP